MRLEKVEAELLLFAEFACLLFAVVVVMLPFERSVFYGRFTAYNRRKKVSF